MNIQYTGTAPQRQYLTDAGADLVSAEDCTIAVGKNRLVSTGTCMAIQAGYVGEVCSRSGMAAKHRVFVLNAPGIVDAGFRGDIKVNLMNLGDKPFKVHKGDRIAQLLVKQLVHVDFQEASTLDDSERGDGGHGSTGD